MYFYVHEKFLKKYLPTYIQEQFRYGIRFFDLRFKLKGGNLFVYHGGIYQETAAEEVFIELKGLLKAHTSETILVAYQQERDTPMNSIPFLRRWGPWGHNDFVVALENSLINHTDLIFKARHYIPILKHVRGKMVFIDIKGHGNGRLGFDRDTLSIEDYWECPEETHKLERVKSHTLQASESSGSQLFLTYTSYSDASCDTKLINKL